MTHRSLVTVILRYHLPQLERRRDERIVEAIGILVPAFYFIVFVPQDVDVLARFR